jgi:hypothetical protein
LFIKHDAPQKGRQIVADGMFPGMSEVRADFGPNEEWYSLKDLAPDLHVLLVKDNYDDGPSYARPPYPATWARQHGKGRVFYTSMGHRADIWTNPTFQAAQVGGLNWAAAPGRCRDFAQLGARGTSGPHVVPADVEPPPSKSAAPQKQRRRQDTEVSKPAATSDALVRGRRCHVAVTVLRMARTATTRFPVFFIGGGRDAGILPPITVCETSPIRHNGHYVN